VKWLPTLTQEEARKTFHDDYHEDSLSSPIIPFTPLEDMNLTARELECLR
jgi:hypothetical protein